MGSGASSLTSPPDSDLHDQSSDYSDDQKTNLGRFPYHILVNILKRLHAKTLASFKCVSKDWFDLITNDQYFLQSHENHSKTNPLLIFKCITYSSPLSHLPENSAIHFWIFTISFELHHYFTIESKDFFQNVIATAGILLIRGRYHHYVCNLNTKEYFQLPDCVGFSHISIGHVPFTNLHKVIRFDEKDHLFQQSGNRGTKFLVLTLHDGAPVETWRDVKAKWLPQTCRDSSTVGVNGKIYWITKDERIDPEQGKTSFGNRARKEKCVISFDLRSESFEDLDHPGSYKDSLNIDADLLQFGGELCLVNIFTRDERMDLWLLKENDVWVKGYSFNYSCIGRWRSENRNNQAFSNTSFDDDHRPEEPRSLTPLALDRGEMLIDLDDINVLRYNIARGSCRYQRNLNHPRSGSGTPYIDNLRFLKRHID